VIFLSLFVKIVAYDILCLHHTDSIDSHHGAGA